MDMWSRSSNTRIIACGTRGRLVIQTIVNDGELNQNLLGYNSERFVTGTVACQAGLCWMGRWMVIYGVVDYRKLADSRGSQQRKSPAS